ncbi:MAG TPA: hypothetical protein PJ982_16515, partial [Lacipirellulaceae bacterium]|nr:hypothetical protein [Lacipirellulaceae bacterium]
PVGSFRTESAWSHHSHSAGPATSFTAALVVGDQHYAGLACTVALRCTTGHVAREPVRFDGVANPEGENWRGSDPSFWRGTLAALPIGATRTTRGPIRFRRLAARKRTHGGTLARVKDIPKG